MKTFNKILAIVFFFVTIFLAGCAKSEEQKTVQETGKQIDSTIIRDSAVEVASLDKNSDGKVFQCSMHADAISDESGECPICLMNLEEHFVADAQKNLHENMEHNH
jgi:nitrous oxide reductase accessory protein NosL